MKAQYARDAVDKGEQIDIYVGVDNGMKYKNGKTDANSKETEKILCQNFLSVGEMLIKSRNILFATSFPL